MPTFTLRIALESAYALTPEQESDENWRIWTAEAVAALTQLTAVLERNDAPATFFVVGKLVERAGPELARLLRDKPGFDVGSHTYSHTDIIDDSPAALERFSRELVLTSDLILDHFGRRPTGFCSPGGHYRGLQGHPGQLAILWEQGYRYIGSDNSGPPEQWQPSPMTQPYWYTDDGFGDLFEVPGTGWHCNYLFNSGGQNDDWSPAPGFPDGTILERLPVTVEEGFEARRREFRYAIDNDLVYSPVDASVVGVPLRPGARTHRTADQDGAPRGRSGRQLQAALRTVPRGGRAGACIRTAPRGAHAGAGIRTAPRGGRAGAGIRTAPRGARAGAGIRTAPRGARAGAGIRTAPRGARAGAGTRTAPRGAHGGAGRGGG